jgi:HEAT repeat protein
MAARTERSRRSGWGLLLLAAFLLLALSGCGGKKSTGELLELAKSKDSADRVRAVRALGERGAEAEVVVPVLAEALKDEDAFVRRDAARGLGQIGPAASAAVPALQTASRDKNQHVRQAATDAIQKIAPGTLPETKKR